MQALWRSAEDALDYAIANEEEAASTYGEFSRQAPNEELKVLFERFAADETRHRDRLMSLKKGKTLKFSAKAMSDLSRQVAPGAATGKVTTVQAAYEFAVKAERDANRLYSILCEMATTQEIRRVFKALAEDEERHRVQIDGQLKKLKSEQGILTKLFNRTKKG